MNVTRRIRTVVAGIAVAALLGGTAAVVVTVPAPHVSGGAAVADAPAPIYDGGQPILAAAPAPYEGTVPSPQQDIKLAAAPGPQQDAAPGPIFDGIQLTTMFQGAAPGPDYED